MGWGMDRKELLDYFMEHTAAKFARMETRFDSQDEKLEQIRGILAEIKSDHARIKRLPIRIERLEKWRWKQTGAMAVVSAIIAGAIAFFGR